MSCHSLSLAGQLSYLYVLQGLEDRRFFSPHSPAEAEHLDIYEEL